MSRRRTPTPTILPPVPVRIVLEFAAQERQARTTGAAGDPTHELMARKLEGAIETHSPAPAGARVLIGGSKLAAPIFHKIKPDFVNVVMAGLSALERAGIRPRRIVEDGAPGVAAMANAFATHAKIDRVDTGRLEEIGGDAVLSIADALVWTDDGARFELLRAAHASGDWIIWEPRAAFTASNGANYRTFVGVRKTLLEGGAL